MTLKQTRSRPHCAASSIRIRDCAITSSTSRARCESTSSSSSTAGARARSASGYRQPVRSTCCRRFQEADFMLWVGTRKGLFKIDHEKIVEHRFAGQPVSAVLQQGRDVYCALNLGHFGAKLWRSRDGGEKWEEIACPAYPKEEGGATLNQIWVLEADDGGVWAGTIPGGLFRSSDGGESWRLIESLWRREERKLWFGGGADAPGIHSVLVDPRDAKRVTIAV